MDTEITPKLFVESIKEIYQLSYDITMLKVCRGMKSLGDLEKQIATKEQIIKDTLSSIGLLSVEQAKFYYDVFLEVEEEAYGCGREEGETRSYEDIGRDWD